MQSAILRRPLVGRTLSLAFVLAVAAALMLAGASSASAEISKNGWETSCDNRNENSHSLPEQASDRAQQAHDENPGVATKCPIVHHEDDGGDDDSSGGPVPLAVGAGTGGQQAATTAGMTAMLATAGLAAAFGRRALRSIPGRA